MAIKPKIDIIESQINVMKEKLGLPITASLQEVVDNVGVCNHSTTPRFILTKGNEASTPDQLFEVASEEAVTDFNNLNTANNLQPSEDYIYVYGYDMGEQFDVMSCYLYYNGNYYQCNKSYVTLGERLYTGDWGGMGMPAIYTGTKDLRPSKLYYLCSDKTYNPGELYNKEEIILSDAFDETLDTFDRYKLDYSYKSTVSYLKLEDSFHNWAPESFAFFFQQFYGITNLDNLVGLNNINMSNCTSIKRMFNQFSLLGTMDLSFLDLSKVTDAQHAFSQSGRIPDIIFEKLQTNIIENMNSMFYGATNEVIPDFDMSHATNIRSLFNQMRWLKKHPKLNAPNVTDINSLFSSCYALPVVDVSTLDLSSLLTPDQGNTHSFFFAWTGQDCLASDGAYANGIPYVYVKDSGDESFILNSLEEDTSRPEKWSSANIIVGSPE